MISIICPVYNQGQYLKDAIESCLAQHVQAELIIIDDGSTDNSLEIARKYETERPDVIKVIHQTNRGLASARNTGIMNANFEWILPLDSDDMLMPKALENIIKVLPTTADVIGLSLRTFGSSDEEIILMDNPVLEDFRHSNRLGYCSLIRKSVLLECGGYNPKMVEGYEDLALWVDLLTRGKKIITIPVPLWMYRTKEQSMWTKITPEIHNKLLNQINQDFPEAKLNFSR